MGLSKFNIAGEPLEIHKADDWEAMYHALMRRTNRLQHELDIAKQKISEYGWATDTTRWGS